jgi:outer membrane receptor protein involved in Fe transport
MPSIAFRIHAILLGGTLLHGLAVAAPAQSVAGPVTGSVAARDGSPLAGARVAMVGDSAGAHTDATGRFRIADAPVGRQRFTAHLIGYQPDTVAIDLRAGIPATVDFRLVQATIVLEPLVVSASREIERRADGSLTIDALGGIEVRQTRATHPAGILNRLAGVHVSETSGEGHTMAMRLQVTTAPMYLYLEDGIPTRPTGFFNHNALYEVNLPQAGGIEVIKGPGTALYGSDAIGGIVNVMTRPAPLDPTVELNAEGGAHGYRRALMTAGGTWGDHGVRADVNVTHSDNWKAQAPFDRQSATIRWDGRFGHWSARTVLAGSRIDQQDVPAISRTLYQTAPEVNLAPVAYRTVRALRLSTALERQWDASLLSITPYARVNEMGLLPSWQLSFDPQTWETRNASIGLQLRFRRDITPWKGRIIVGIDGDLSPGSFLARQAIVTRSGPNHAWTAYADGDTHYDYDVTYTGFSPYLQTSWNPVGALRVDAGVRADMAGYAYESRLDAVATGAHRVPPDTTVSYSHLSPKIGATYAVSPAMSVYGSFRHGFRVPSFGQLFTQNTAANTIDLEPVTVDSWEAGVRGQLGGRTVYQLAVYTMHVRDDILTYVTEQNTREARNAGSARHRGIEASVGVVLPGSLRLDAAWSTASHRYLDWVPRAPSGGTPGVAYSGNLIEQAPRTIGSAMLAWSPGSLGGGRIALEWAHLGRYAQDAGNTEFYEGHHLLNVHANAFVTPQAELFLRVTNLGDVRYAELSSYDAFQRDTYTPGAPRSLFGGVRYAW